MPLNSDNLNIDPPAYLVKLHELLLPFILEYIVSSKKEIEDFSQKVEKEEKEARIHDIDIKLKEAKAIVKRLQKELNQAQA